MNKTELIQSFFSSQLDKSQTFTFVHKKFCKYAQRLRRLLTEKMTLLDQPLCKSKTSKTAEANFMKLFLISCDILPI